MKVVKASTGDFTKIFNTSSELELVYEIRQSTSSKNVLRVPERKPTGIITMKYTGDFMNDEHAQQIAEQWLTQAAESAGQKDLNGHMGMISKRVSVEGVPGFDNIDYDIWFKQCRHQFEMSMIKSIAYKGFNLINAAESLINFTVYETVVGSDGSLNEQIVEMSLEKEDDNVWRLVKERILIENDAMRNHELS